ncbi:hypothetical protein BCR44DRAFT_34378 [Catenaria anguillulae PL171]|uniref:ABC transporter domain-containing protein n=1 Tax=Catenaria anguillulae PL171 TaxID=765915 RepID=A0A1Y2HKS9_9FUNG|nr:hypothetical protein BCR44DRAFT_34378 [Catenaria anguillulae PL171]
MATSGTPQAASSSIEHLAASGPLLRQHDDQAPAQVTPSSVQMWAMVRVRAYLYKRNVKLALTGILFPLAMIGIAIGMSALIMSSVANSMPKTGTSLPSIPLLAPPTSLDMEGLRSGSLEPRPLVLVAGGSDDAAIRAIQGTMDQYFTATRQRARWLRVQSAQQLNDLQLDMARKRSSNSGSADENRNPVGGFFLHQAPTASQPLNMSLVVNADSGEGAGLQRVAPHVLTILNSAVQSIIPVSGPASNLIPRSGQDPRTLPAQGPVAPSGPAAAQLVGSIFAQYASLAQSPAGAGTPPPWQVGFNGSISTFRAQSADRFDLSVSLVPPFVTYGLYFMTAFLTEQLVRERADGQFDYFVVNTLSPTAYYTSFFIISSGFLLLPCAAASIGLGIWVQWFRESNWLGIVLLFLAFSATTVTGSGFFSFFFRSKQAVGPVLGFGSAVVTFLPYFVFEFGVKSEVGLGVVYAITAFLPSFGLYRALAIVAQAHIAGKPMTGFSFSEPILPVLLILIAQAILGYALTIALANSTTTGEATGTAPIASLLTRTKAAESDADIEARPPGEHPNAAIPLDPYLLAEKRRIQEGRIGEREDVVAVKGLCMDFMTVEKRGDGLFSRDKVSRMRVLDDLYLSLFKNESLAFLGPNGAGKSTAISILIGLLKPTRGSATICNKSVVPFDPAIKRTLGVCPQHDKTFPDLTVREHLEAFARIKGLANVEGAVQTALKDMALVEVEHKQCKELSGGNRRRLSIAIACLGRPQVVILDEPTTGVDVATRRTIWNSITELKKHSSVILVTHAMDEADALCERIGIMINGSLVCLGTPQRLKSLYGAAYKITLRFHSTDMVAPALQGLHAQFPRGSVKVLNEASGGPNLDVEIDMAKLAAAYTGSTDLITQQQQEPQRLPDGRTVLVESAAVDRSRVTARFLGEVFGLVASRRDEWGITDWSVGEVTLSEVFVRLAKYHRSHVEEEEKRKEATAM